MVRILILGSSILPRMVLKEIIAAYGEHEVHGASDGKGGMELFHKLKPGIMFHGLTIKTILQFLGYDVEGYPFMLPDINTAGRLKGTINRSMEPYK